MEHRPLDRLCFGDGRTKSWSKFHSTNTPPIDTCRIRKSQVQSRTSQSRCNNCPIRQHMTCSHAFCRNFRLWCIQNLLRMHLRSRFRPRSLLWVVDMVLVAAHQIFCLWSRINSRGVAAFPSVCIAALAHSYAETRSIVV